MSCVIASEIVLRAWDASGKPIELVAVVCDRADRRALLDERPELSGWTLVDPDSTGPLLVWLSPSVAVAPVATLASVAVAT